MARKPSRRSANSTRSSNTLRIIAGEWRGRKLQFPDQEGLRPTPDRVRETLFNWIQVQLPGSRCLDLFSGSGALALEALSRGAKQAILIDSSKAVVNQLRTNLKLLSANNAEVVHSSAMTWLEGQQSNSANIDLVFLDPPFRQQLLDSCCQLLESSQLLAPEALIYIEAEQELTHLPTPKNWRLLKQKRSGQVISYLFQRQESR